MRKAKTQSDTVESKQVDTKQVETKTPPDSAAAPNKMKKVRLPKPLKNETADEYRKRMNELLQANNARYSKKRNANSAINKWQAALREAGVRGVPKKNTPDYERVIAIYKKL